MLPLPQYQTERLQRNLHQRTGRPEQLRRVRAALRPFDSVHHRYRQLCHLHPRRLSKRELHLPGRFLQLPGHLLPDVLFRLLPAAIGPRYGGVGVSDGNAVLPGGGWVPRRSLLRRDAALLLDRQRLLLRSP